LSPGPLRIGRAPQRGWPPRAFVVLADFTPTGQAATFADHRSGDKAGRPGDTPSVGARCTSLLATEAESTCSSTMRREDIRPLDPDRDSGSGPVEQPLGRSRSARLLPKGGAQVRQIVNVASDAAGSAARETVYAEPRAGSRDTKSLAREVPPWAWHLVCPGPTTPGFDRGPTSSRALNRADSHGRSRPRGLPKPSASSLPRSSYSLSGAPLERASPWSTDKGLRTDVHHEEGYYRRRDGGVTAVVDDLAGTPGPAATTSPVTYSADGGWTDPLTCGELAERRTASHRAAELGSKPARGLLQLPNWCLHRSAPGLQPIGAISCPLIPILRRREVEYVVGLIGARVYIVPTRFRRFDFAALANTVLGSVDCLEHVFTIDGPRGAGGSFERHFLGRSREDIPFDELAARHPRADGRRDDPVHVGTTGEPNGVCTPTTACTRRPSWALGVRPGRSDVVMKPPAAHASGFLYGVLMR